MRHPVLIIHGGAGSRILSSSRKRQMRRKFKTVLERSYPVLLEKGALSAVIYAVKLLEDDTAFNAGTGSSLQSDGRARISASLMDGRTERFSAVLNLEDIKNPILVAHALLSERHRVLAGPGARAYALSLGMKPQDVRTKKAIRRWRRRKKLEKAEQMGTVGACALDREGNLASATSTGGMGVETPHRVSDTAMPVANFADGLVAVSATGVGEEIIEEGLAIKIATRVADGASLRQAFSRTFREVRRKGRRMGAIAVDRRGQVRAETTTDLLLCAYQKGSKRSFIV